MQVEGRREAREEGQVEDRIVTRWFIQYCTWISLSAKAALSYSRDGGEEEENGQEKETERMGWMDKK